MRLTEVDFGNLLHQAGKIGHRQQRTETKVSVIVGTQAEAEQQIGTNTKGAAIPDLNMGVVFQAVAYTHLKLPTKRRG